MFSRNLVGIPCGSRAPPIWTHMTMHSYHSTPSPRTPFHYSHYRAHHFEVRRLLKISEISLDGAQGLFGTRLFKKVELFKELFSNSFESLYRFKVQENCFLWAMVISTRLDHHENEDFSDLWQMQVSSPGFLIFLRSVGAFHILRM